MAIQFLEDTIQNVGFRLYSIKRLKPHSKYINAEECKHSYRKLKKGTELTEENQI